MQIIREIASSLGFTRCFIILKSGVSILEFVYRTDYGVIPWIFFEKFKPAEYEFTYGAEEDSEHHNALQVGLVAWFYLDKGHYWLLMKRDDCGSVFIPVEE
ncbi:hypothetical protein CIT292_07598 [Citrobacter youngae ATCC 29220]|uniref:Uncharacterized protein n=1 Tax=Citrobacter youngae ATCC 29220 TaxID=500640 RepID=D4BAV2_9ENTR|nr:hypothetical protein CIT292_07598 [Citrobacter youngae ATCC 29220]